MNLINFNQAGGFPLETNTLDALQEAYKIFNSLGEIVGNKAIIKGCTLSGTTVSDGFIYLNGELLEFRGGQQQTTIIITEETTQMEFEDGVMRDVYMTRYAQFGTGIDAIAWSDFVRAYPLTSALYIDKVDMYAGDIANIPLGWYLCDGQNGTVDLRKRFIVGLDSDDPDYNAIGNTGGSKEIAITIDQMPEHNHTASSLAAGNHHHRLKDGGGGDKTNSITLGGGNLAGQDYPTNWVDDNSIIEDSGSHTHSISVNNKGGNQAHENRPPYYTLAFIQFKGI